MSLRIKTLMVVGLMLGSALALIYLFSGNFILNNFIELDEQFARRNVGRVVEAIDNKIDEMNRMNADYARWDDTYAFIKDGNQKYMSANLIDATFSNLKLSVMLFVDPSGKVVFSKGFDLSKNEEAPVSPWFKENLSPASPLVQHENTTSMAKGIVSLPEGIMLISSMPILKSDITGPIRGVLIFGRYLSSAEAAEISKMTKTSFFYNGWEERETDPNCVKARFLLTESNPVIIQTAGEEHLTGHTSMKDIFGKPALMIHLELERSIYEQGKRTVVYFGGLFAAAALALILIMSVLLERIILRRVIRLTAEMIDISSSKNTSLRVTSEGKDELADLACGINLAMSSLESSIKSQGESEKKFKKLFDSMPDAVYLETLEGKIVDCNAAAEKMTGYSKEEILGLSAKDLVPDDAAKLFPEVVEKTVTLGKFELDAFNKKKTGEIFPVRVVIAAIEIKGIKYLLVVVNDTTEQKRVGRELGERVLELEKFQNLTTGRELKMIDYEKEINSLLAELGRKPKY